MLLRHLAACYLVSIDSDLKGQEGFVARVAESSLVDSKSLAKEILDSTEVTKEIKKINDLQNSTLQLALAQVIENWEMSSRAKFEANLAAEPPRTRGSRFERRVSVTHHIAVLSKIMSEELWKNSAEETLNLVFDKASAVRRSLDLELGHDNSIVQLPTLKHIFDLSDTMRFPDHF